MNGFIALSQFNEYVLSTQCVHNRMTRAGTDSKRSHNMGHKGTPLQSPIPLKVSGRCGWEDTKGRASDLSHKAASLEDTILK